MNREEILKKAQNEKDERVLLEEVKAQKLGGGISSIAAACAALALVVDGFLLENYRTYDFLTVAFMFMAIGMLSNGVAALYKFIKLKDNGEIKNIACCGIVIVCAMVMVIKSFL